MDQHHDRTRRKPVITDFPNPAVEKINCQMVELARTFGAISRDDPRRETILHDILALARRLDELKKTQ
jgi:hypothetical protein